MKLVYALPWDIDPVGPLSNDFPDIEFVHAASGDIAAKEVQDADILVVGGRNYADVLADAVHTKAPELKWLQSTSIGIDRFLSVGIPDHIQFTNAAGLKGTTCAEHAIALLLAQLHAVPRMMELKAEKTWGRDLLVNGVHSVEGTTMLCVGYGSIGQEIARKAKAFDMRVIAFNSSGSGDGPADEVKPLSDLDHYLSDADAILTSLPLSDDTKHLFNAERFKAMNSNMVFVNVGRGGIVDQNALCQALSDGEIAAACLDVFEEEPIAEDDPVWTAPNLILSPHVAAIGGPMYQVFAKFLTQNIELFLAGKPLKNEIRPVTPNSGTEPSKVA